MLYRYKASLAMAENTHLLRKGKYNCTADLLFDGLGFGQTNKSVYSFNSKKQLNLSLYDSSVPRNILTLHRQLG